MFSLLHEISIALTAGVMTIYVSLHMSFRHGMMPHWRIWNRCTSCKIIAPGLLPGFVRQRPPYRAFGLKYRHVVVWQWMSASSTQHTTHHDPQKIVAMNVINQFVPFRSQKLSLPVGFRNLKPEINWNNKIMFVNEFPRLIHWWFKLPDIRRRVDAVKLYVTQDWNLYKNPCGSQKSPPYLILRTTHKAHLDVIGWTDSETPRNLDNVTLTSLVSFFNYVQ